MLDFKSLKFFLISFNSFFISIDFSNLSFFFLYELSLLSTSLSIFTFFLIFPSIVLIISFFEFFISFLIRFVTSSLLYTFSCKLFLVSDNKLFKVSIFLLKIFLISLFLASTYNLLVETDTSTKPFKLFPKLSVFFLIKDISFFILSCSVVINLVLLILSAI